jgi:hypothetical protein
MKTRFNLAFLLLLFVVGCASSVDTPLQAVFKAPASIDFGTVAQNQCKDTSITFLNTGNTELAISSHSFSNPMFSLADSGQRAIKIGVQSSQNVIYRYCPISTVPVTAYDTIRYGSSETVVALNGGVSARILIAPGIIDFGTLRVGETKDTIITFENRGNDTLLISSTTITGDVVAFKLINGSFPVVIPPGSKATFDIQFSPQHAGSSSAKDSIVSNATEGASQIALYGTGLPVVIDLGTTYSHSAYRVDSAGNKVVGSDTKSIGEIVEKGISLSNKSDVFVYIETGVGSVSRDTSYIHYEQNGNISFRVAPLVNSRGGGWVELPVMTQGSAKITDYDSTLANGEGHIKLIERVEYLGEEEITASGHVFQTSKVRYSVQLEFTNRLGKVFNEVSSNLFWYTERVGNFVRQEIRRDSDIPGREVHGGAVVVLTDSSLL